MAALGGKPTLDRRARQRRLAPVSAKRAFGEISCRLPTPSPTQGIKSVSLPHGCRVSDTQVRLRPPPHASGTCVAMVLANVRNGWKADISCCPRLQARRRIQPFTSAAYPLLCIHRTAVKKKEKVMSIRTFAYANARHPCRGSGHDGRSRLRRATAEAPARGPEGSRNGNEG